MWSKLGNAKPKKKLAFADMGGMVCTMGLNMFGDLGLQKDVMEKTKMVVRGIKRLNERVEAAVKTAKWLLFNNTERGDMINTKGVTKALLQDSQGQPPDKPAEALIQGMDHGLP